MAPSSFGYHAEGESSVSQSPSTVGTDNGIDGEVWGINGTSDADPLLEEVIRTTANAAADAISSAAFELVQNITDTVLRNTTGIYSAVGLNDSVPYLEERETNLVLVLEERGPSSAEDGIGPQSGSIGGVGGANILLEEDPLLTDVWIGLFLMLMAFMCAGYLCTCLLYHKFKRWKRRIVESQRASEQNMQEEYQYEEPLPSYTIVTGLPSYEQAMEQLRQMRAMRKASLPKNEQGSASAADYIDTAPPRLTFARASLGEIFQFYKTDKNLPV